MLFNTGNTLDDSVAANTRTSPSFRMSSISSASDEPLYKRPKLQLLSSQQQQQPSPLLFTNTPNTSNTNTMANANAVAISQQLENSILAAANLSSALALPLSASSFQLSPHHLLPRTISHHHQSQPCQSSSSSPPAYHKCQECQKLFWSENALKHHISLYHSLKAFVCETCGKAFRFRSNLAEHRSVHSSVKPYVCKFCGKSSRLKGNLTKHILKHHKKEQNASAITSDDIIIKKGKKSLKDPMAMDFIHKSMIVLPNDVQRHHSITSVIQQNHEYNKEKHHHSTTASSSEENTMSESETTANLEASVKGRRPIAGDQEGHCSPPSSRLNDTYSPLSQENGENEESPVKTETGAVDGTQCDECGKHFRKSTSLIMHMQLKHPLSNNNNDNNLLREAEGPPHHVKRSMSVTDQMNHFSPFFKEHQNDDPNDDNETNKKDGFCTELRELKDLLVHMRNLNGTNNDKMDHVLQSLDSRVIVLEKQVDLVLTNCNHLMGLQTTINSAFGRFRDDVNTQLKSLSHLLCPTLPTINLQQQNQLN